MDAQQFLAEFSHVASAPGGLQQVRELVIYLAIHGELNTDGKSEPEAAQQLIAYAVELKRKMRDAGEARREQQLPAIPESLAAEYPSTWALTRLGGVVHLISGQHLSSEEQNSYGVGFPYLTGASDFGPLHPVVTRWTTVERAVAKRGDFLIAVKGTIGKINLLNLERAALGRQLMAVRALAIDPAFLALILRSNENYFLSKRVGIAIPGISREDILHLVVGIPSRDEQERVVAKVDELMALCDELEEQHHRCEELRRQAWTATLNTLVNSAEKPTVKIGWDRVHDNMMLMDSIDGIADLRRAIIDLGVRGMLTKSSSVENDLEERARGRITDLTKRKLIRKRTWISDAHVRNRFDLPTDFQKVYLGNIAELITDGEHATPARIPNGPVPLVTAKNVRDGFFDLKDTDFVSEEVAVKAWTRCKPRDNDIIMVCVGATTGRLLVAKEPVDMVLVRSVALIRMFSNLFLPEFVAYCLRSNWGQRQIWGNVKQAAQPCLYLNRIAQLQITAPPFEEQQRIVETLDRLLLTCDRLSELSEAASGTAASLASAAVAAITGIRIEGKEKMKTPKTELVSNLRMGVSPASKEQAPLATILIRHQTELSAKALWGISGLEIDAFYQQLKIEMANGWIVQPEAAYVKELETA